MKDTISQGYNNNNIHSRKKQQATIKEENEDTLFREMMATVALNKNASFDALSHKICVSWVADRAGRRLGGNSRYGQFKLLSSTPSTNQSAPSMIHDVAINRQRREIFSSKPKTNQNPGGYSSHNIGLSQSRLQ